MTKEWTKRKEIMLCYPFEIKRLRKWKPPYIVERKLDGERARILTFPSGDVTIFSSEANVKHSVPHIAQAFEGFSLRGLELDGEIYRHGMPRSEIHSRFSRNAETLHEDYGALQFHTFDLISDERQADRLVKLVKLPIFTSSVVQLVVPEIVQDLQGVLDKLQQYLDEGYEGIIVRHMDAYYHRNRSPYIMKYKPWRKDVYRIVGFKREHDQYGTPKDSLGSLTCQGDDGALFSVGTGPLLTKLGRKRLWQERESLPGQYLEVHYQRLTSKRGVPLECSAFDLHLRKPKVL